MTEYEIENCKKNISFYKDQMKKGRDVQFYIKQINYMKNKVDKLKNYSNNMTVN